MVKKIIDIRLYKAIIVSNGKRIEKQFKAHKKAVAFISSFKENCSEAKLIYMYQQTEVFDVEDLQVLSKMNGID